MAGAGATNATRIAHHVEQDGAAKTVRRDSLVVAQGIALVGLRARTHHYNTFYVYNYTDVAVGRGIRPATWSVMKGDTI